MVTSAIKVGGDCFCLCLYVCVRVCNWDSSKSYEWIFLKLAVDDHRQKISLKFDLDDTLSIYLPSG